MPQTDLPTDPLTGALTRQSLDRRLQEELARSRRYRHSFSLLLLDLDYFKSINDAYGHQRGDQALAEVARIIRAQARTIDELYRYGGDEFLLLLPETNRQAAAALAERVLEAVRSTPIPGKPPIHLSLSIGVASFPEDADTITELFEIADRRHYLSKARGRGRVTWSDEEEALPKDAARAPSRMLERDAAVHATKAFFETLLEHGRGELRVAGEAGVGFRRFLREVRSLAKMMGYAVLYVEGRPAYQGRQYAALQHAFARWTNRPSHMLPDTLLSLVESIIARKQLLGLIVFVHNWEALDFDSQKALLHFSRAASLPVMGLVFSMVQPLMESGRWLLQGQDDVIRRQVVLHPLSEEGVKIWLRYSLEGEPAECLVDVVVRATGGRPLLIRRTLRWLATHQLLTRAGEHWTLTTAFDEKALERFIKQGGKPAVRLPRARRVLIGREKEIPKLIEHMLSSRLVTLVGPDGNGKSALALQVALEIQEKFPDGVYWVTFPQPISLESALVQLANQIALDPHIGDPLDVLRQFLSTRKVLLCLDDLDNVQGARLLLADLLDAGPNVNLLVTMHYPSGLKEERAFEVQGLEVPPEYNAGSLTFYPAVRLFLECARPVDIDLDVEGEHLAEVCRLAGGMPLALELAAGWVSMMSCEQIAARLRSSLSETPRNNVLAAAFDTTWQLFLPQEQEMLLKLSVMKGKFSAEAARDVAGTSPFFLNALAQHALLFQDRSGLFAFPSPFYQYLRHAAADATQLLAEAQRRHARFYLQRLARLQEITERAQKDAAIWRLAEEGENIFAAWSWITREKEIAQLHRLLPAMADWLRTTAQFNRGLAALRHTWKACEIEASSHLEFAARLIRYLGEFCFHLGLYDEALTWFDRLSQIGPHRDRDNEEMLVDYLHALKDMAASLAAKGDFVRAEETLHDALSLLPEKHPEIRYSLQSNLGVILYRRGAFDRAALEMQKTLALARERGDRQRIASALNNLSNALFETGDLKAALRAARESLSLLNGQEGVTFQATVLDTIGKIYTRLGNLPAAADAFQRALSLLQDRSAQPLVLEVLTGVAELCKQAGWQDRAAMIAAGCLGRQEQMPVDVVRRLRQITDRADKIPLLELSMRARHILGELAIA